MLLLLCIALAAYQAIDATSAAAALRLPPTAAACPCANPSLCRPVQVVHEREVFGFSVSRDTPYERYDWRQLTTVAFNEDPALLCAAHAAGARVVGLARFEPAELLGNASARSVWVAAQVARARELHLDGLNFDYEEPLPPGSPLAAGYSALVAEAAAAFHAHIPGSQVSVDVPWSPHGIDSRHYDWAGLAAAADLLFIMAYDMQSQIWGPCVASANAPAARVGLGARQWLELGVPARKLVLGLPWYGYRYHCQNPSFASGEEQECALRPVPFRGAPCSDAAGSQLAYADIAAAVRRGSAAGNNSGSGSSGSGEAELLCEAPGWDEGQQSPYTACRRASDPPGSRRFQVWYDDPASLALKYATAAHLGLRGVGMWHLDALDYRCADAACSSERAAMWAALRAFTAPPALGGSGGGLAVA